MKIRSLGYQTELLFHRFNGQVIDRGDYLVIQTPSNPGFFWGNLLLFSNPPSSQDYPRWIELFKKEFENIPEARHVTLAWDGVDGQLGEIGPFKADGFVVEHSAVMATNSVVRPSKYHEGISVRPILTDEEWAAATENQVLCRNQEFEISSYRLFKKRQMERYRQMAKAGLGHWFGAFIGDQLVGDLGIFCEGELGRFQSVGTHPNFRRLGVCGALVYQASEYLLKSRKSVKTLVMVAEPDAHPFKIYASVGFKEIERIAGLYWWKS